MDKCIITFEVDGEETFMCGQHMTTGFDSRPYKLSNCISEGELVAHISHLFNTAKESAIRAYTKKYFLK